LVAVTLVAFGNACPELLLNSVGALRNESDLSLPAILGSGMIAFGLIPSLSLLCNTPIEQKLLIRPILREVFDS
jgi:Ca2+/Na+ antiporter